MKEINLKRLLKEVIGKNPNKHVSIAGDSVSVEKCLDAMKEACKEVLELAAENAEEEYSDKQEWSEFHQEYINPICGVKKQSILDTINQVK